MYKIVRKNPRHHKNKINGTKMLNQTEEIMSQCYFSKLIMGGILSIHPKVI